MVTLKWKVGLGVHYDNDLHVIDLHEAHLAVFDLRYPCALWKPLELYFCLLGLRISRKNPLRNAGDRMERNASDSEGDLLLSSGRSNAKAQCSLHPPPAEWLSQLTLLCLFPGHRFFLSYVASSQTSSRCSFFPLLEVHECSSFVELNKSTLHAWINSFTIESLCAILSYQKKEGIP